MYLQGLEQMWKSFFCSECMHPWLNGIGVYNMEAYNKNQVTQ